MRTFGFNAQTKAAVVSGVVQFTQSDIGASTGIVALGLKIGGTGNGRYVGSGGVERIVVKADNVPVFDLSYPHIRAQQQRFLATSRYPLLADRFAMISDVATGTRYYPQTWETIIPLNFSDRKSEIEADQCQFPPGASISVEIYTGATITTSANFQLGWKVTNQPAQFTSKNLQQFLNFAASTNAQGFPLQQGGFLRGLTLPGYGATRYRVTASGVVVVDCSVSTIETATLINDGNLLRALQQENDVQISGENQDSDTHPDHIGIILDVQLPLATGSSKVEADLNANYLTTAPENTCSVWTYEQLAGR